MAAPDDEQRASTRMSELQDHDRTFRSSGDEVVWETAVSPSTPLRTHVTVTRRADGTCTAVVAIGGELCGHTAPVLQAELEGLLAQDVVGLEVDLRALALCTSHGLAVFEAVDQQLRNDTGGSLVLRGPVGVVDRVLRIVRAGDPSFSPDVHPAHVA